MIMLNGFKYVRINEVFNLEAARYAYAIMDLNMLRINEVFNLEAARYDMLNGFKYVRINEVFTFGSSTV